MVLTKEFEYSGRYKCITMNYNRINTIIKVGTKRSGNIEAAAISPGV